MAPRSQIFLFAFLIAAPFVCPGQAQVAPGLSIRAVPPARHAIQVKRLPIEGGAELLVLLKEGGVSVTNEERGGSLPLIAVLRDTLGDADASDDRLRYLWSLTAVRPAWWQRITSALPFFYWRVGGARPSQRPLSPLLDFAKVHRPTLLALGGAAGQSLILDSQGTFIRSSSRALRGNAGDYGQAHLARALSVLTEASGEPDVERAFTPLELEQMQARLQLARQPLGGLVSHSRLTEVYDRRRLETQSTRGHNWELLRQRAEAEHLLFEPLFDRDGTARFALVEVERQDLGSERSFDRRFLNVSDPWSDRRLRSWKGYSLKGTLDHPDRIPLGLYSLDYPRVPLLVVDFRDARAPRRKELLQRTVTDVASGVLGLSYISNWYYFAGRTVYGFVRGRHGAAQDRVARARSYEELRLFLLLDDQWDAGFKSEVVKRLGKTSVNPLDGTLRAEVANAHLQYEQLARAAADPKKLAARLDRDRRAEMTPLVHGPVAQRWLKAANVFSLGFYTHRERSTPVLLDLLARQRRIDTQKEYLREVLASSPELDVITDPKAMSAAVRELGQARRDPAAPPLLRSVLQATHSEVLRRECLTALRQLETGSGPAQTDLLPRLPNSQEPATGEGTPRYGSGSPAMPLRGQ